jgi:hypothetical protein
MAHRILIDDVTPSPEPATSHDREWASRYGVTIVFVVSGLFACVARIAEACRYDVTMTVFWVLALTTLAVGSAVIHVAPDWVGETFGRRSAGSPLPQRSQEPKFATNCPPRRATPQVRAATALNVPLSAKSPFRRVSGAEPTLRALRCEPAANTPI